MNCIYLGRSGRDCLTLSVKKEISIGKGTLIMKLSCEKAFFYNIYPIYFIIPLPLPIILGERRGGRGGRTWRARGPSLPLPPHKVFGENHMMKDLKMPC